MNPTISFKNKIEELINTKKQISAIEIRTTLGISKPTLFKHLHNLVEEKRISKIGKPPKVYYVPVNVNEVSIGGRAQIVTSSPEIKQYIDENYLIITPSGEWKSGWDGFFYWCTKTNQEINKTARVYFETAHKYDKLKYNGLVVGTSKIRSTFPQNTFIDRVYYLDFYSIEGFGKTKLGQMLLYAKQSQNRKIINNLVGYVQPKIMQVIRSEHIDAIGFMPPTVKREVQLMKELERGINYGLPKIEIIKVTGEIAIPQKTLSKLSDRVENAASTIIIQGQNVYKNILLIDDAVGSGASFNETAKKIKERKLCTNTVIGLAITGSLKGFDVISEV